MSWTAIITIIIIIIIIIIVIIVNIIIIVIIGIIIIIIVITKYLGKAYPPEVCSGGRLLKGNAHPQNEISLLHIFFHDVKHILRSDHIICISTASERHGTYHDSNECMAVARLHIEVAQYNCTIRLHNKIFPVWDISQSHQHLLTQQLSQL